VWQERIVSCCLNACSSHRGKLHKYGYDRAGFEAFKADVDLIISNCLTFNADDKELMELAERLQRFADKEFAAQWKRACQNAVILPRAASGVGDATRQA
jgi:Bromodomain